MDPFIESSDRWGGFHLGMVVAMAGQLNARLPDRFVAAAAEYVLVQEPDTGRRKSREPDVYVSKRSGAAPAAYGGPVATASTTIMLPAVQPKRRRYVKIEDKERR